MPSSVLPLRQVLRFAAVGCVGFVADAGALLMLTRGARLDPLVARALSFLAAATLTFWLNRRYTFRAAGDARAQWLRYVLATGAGALINIGAFWAWIAVAGTSAVQLVAGLVIGSLLAMTFNYFISCVVVFRPAPDGR